MDLAEYKGIYVIAEQFEGKLRDVSFELLGQARILADTIGDEVGAILIGKDVKPFFPISGGHSIHADSDFMVKSDGISFFQTVDIQIRKHSFANRYKRNHSAAVFFHPEA
mgnify:CR=1 FL=1